jgi:hypothetical protein
MRKVKVQANANTVIIELPVTVRDLKDLDLKLVHEQITSAVGDRALEMVQRTIAEVCKGHYSQMKYLFELAGLGPRKIVEEPPQEDSLAKTLMDHLQLLQLTTSGEAEAQASPEKVEHPTPAVE